MKKLYLIRHAKSSWSHPDLPDFERSLNKRGKHDAPLMGALLKERGVLPDYFLSSPAKRAIVTAKKIAAEIGFPREEIVCNPEIYLADRDTLSNLIKELPDEYQTVFLVGHNPGLTELVNWLGDQFISNVPTCAVCYLELPVEHWKEIKQQVGTLKRFDYPKKYWASY